MIYKFCKRAFDLICSAAAILVSLPIWAVVAIGIKLSSKGPIFYRADRVGQNGKLFTMYKFRSMHVFQPENGSEKKTEGGYIANAQRIFPLGNFLRKSKIDELPQLINILRGDMSVVGPRPVSTGAVAKNYQGEYACILDVRPGLACLDSIYDYAHGELFVKDNEEYKRTVLPVRTELAKMYVKEATFGMDLAIIFRTVWLIIAIVAKKRDFPYTKYEKRAMETVFGKTEAQL